MDVKFHFSTSPALFDTLHQTPTKVISPASRLVIPRAERAGWAGWWAMLGKGGGKIGRKQTAPSVWEMKVMRTDGAMWKAFRIQRWYGASTGTTRRWLGDVTPKAKMNIRFRVYTPTKEHGALAPVPTSSLDGLPTSLLNWVSHPCVLCGHGDNSVQHWPCSGARRHTTPTSSMENFILVPAPFSSRIRNWLKIVLYGFPLAN